MYLSVRGSCICVLEGHVFVCKRVMYLCVKVSCNSVLGTVMYLCVRGHVFVLEVMYLC